MVTTLELRDSVLKTSAERFDGSSVKINSRMQTCSDLVAAEARYHRACQIAFLKNRSLPASTNIDECTAGKRGWKGDTEKVTAFENFCNFLELEGELYSLEELQEIMKSFSEDVYSIKHLERKLKEKYGEHLLICSYRGKKNVVCLRNFASSILNDKWYTDRKSTLHDEQKRVVETAAKLIVSEIRDATS